MKPYRVLLALCLILTTACAAPTVALPLVPTATAAIAPTTTPAALATTTLAATITPEAADYLEAAITIMETNGINRLVVDWQALRSQAAEMARSAQTTAETYGAIRFALRAAGGRHSFFLTPQQAAAKAQTTMADSPPPRAKLLLDRLAYVALAGFGSTDPDEEARYATLVQHLIRNLDAEAPCGWIVDLRENTGGNMYPMLAGLGPILGEGVAGHFIDPEGLSTDWSYHAGQSFYGNEGATRVTGPAFHLQADQPPVAVLTGIRTASSGEAMVISFRGLPNTRSFGHYTAGLSTGNAGHTLSDGALIILTGVVMADRTGQAYGEAVPPDETVDDVRQFALLMDEAIPQPAVDWLLAQPACAMP